MKVVRRFWILMRYAVKLRIHELAAKELLDAVKWYNQLQDGLGARFQAMVVLQVGKIRKTPEWFPRESQEIFKVYVPKFPYKILYSVEGDSIVIWAIAHMHRKPWYWQSRIK
jgi:hypothetical protein